METATKTQNLVTKLATIMSEVGRIEKRGRNEFHKYDYAMEADIVEALRNKLAERNVMIVPSCVSVERKETLTTAELRFHVLDGDSGESLVLSWFGTGEDKGDKGLYKAFTGALKYFLMKLFLLPTGDDPETDETQDKTRGKTELRAPRKRQDAKPAADKPEPETKPAPVTAAPLADTGATVQTAKPRSLAGGKTIYDITMSDGIKYVTFSKSLYDQAASLVGQKLAAIQADEPNRFGDRKLNALIPSEASTVTRELADDDIPF